MKSIRGQLMVRLFIATAVLWATGNVGIYLYVRHALQREFDDALVNRAMALSRLIAWGESGSLIVEIPEQQLQEFRRSKNPEYFEVWRPDGQVFMRSESLKGTDLASGDLQARDVKMLDGLPGRAVTYRFVPHSEADEPLEPGETKVEARPHEPGEATLVLASGRMSLDETLAHLAEGLIVVGGTMALICALVMMETAKRGLRPLYRLMSEAEQFHAEGLHIRFSLKEMPSELLPIVERLNELLARIEETFARERRFTADAAHELRTPLAELRTMAEVALKWPRERGTATREFTEVHAIATQMERLVDSLLAMARCATGRQPVEMEPEIVEEVMREEWKGVAGKAAKRGLEVRWEVTPDLRIWTDRLLLGCILRNLFSNSVEYAPAGSVVECSARKAGEEVMLQVVNVAGRLEPGDIPHLFEPFWRKEKSRTGTEHAGLGLSVASEYAAVMGVRLRAALIEGGRLAMTIEIPPHEAGAETEMSGTAAMQ